MTADIAAPEAPANPAEAPRSSRRSPPSDAFIVVPDRAAWCCSRRSSCRSPSAGPAAIAAAQQAVREQRQIVVVLQRDPESPIPGRRTCTAMGVVANILRYVTAPDGEHHIVCQGVQRFRSPSSSTGWPYLVARGLHIPEPAGDGDAEIEARFLNLAPRRWRSST